MCLVSDIILKDIVLTGKKNKKNCPLSSFHFIIEIPYNM